MKTTAELNYDGYIINIVGEYNEPERGSRDSYGAPLEPDFNAWFEIISIHIGEKEFEDYQHLASFLDISERYTYELIDEALQDAYEGELDLYYESQIGNQYD